MTGSEQAIHELLVKAKVGTIESPYTPRCGPNSHAPKIDLFVTSLNQQSSLAINLLGRFGTEIRSVAIEVQDSGSRKHRMGDILNGAFNADVGFVVCTHSSGVRICEKLKEYLVEKGILTPDRRVIIVDTASFKKILHPPSSK